MSYCVDIVPSSSGEVIKGSETFQQPLSMQKKKPFRGYVYNYKFCDHDLMSMEPWHILKNSNVRSGGRVVERRTVNRGDGGSISPTAVAKLRQFRSPHICLCLSEETLKPSGPFYLVSMPGEVKISHTGVNV